MLLLLLPTNHLGMPMHPTDMHLCWRDKGKKGVEKAQRIRDAYDKLAEVDQKALDFLIEEIRELAHAAGNDAGYESGYYQAGGSERERERR